VPGDGFTMRFQFLFIDWTYEPRATAITLIFLGAIVLAIALTAATFAAQGFPGWTSQLTGLTYRTKSTSATKQAIFLLLISRVTTIAAAVMILVGTAIAWSADLQKPKSAQSAIVQLETGAVCGSLSHASGGSLQVTPPGGTAQAIPATGTIVLVESCP
jgi:membrane-bound ClpP family serine protease